MNFLKLLIFIIIIFIINFSSIYSINVSGDVTGTWKKVNNPYIVVGDIRVPPNKSLLIEPGVNVFFKDYYCFKISKNAILSAKGEKHYNILFTSLFPENKWRGLRFYEADSSSLLSYCQITNGYASGTQWDEKNGGGVYLNYSDILIENCKIIQNEADGRGGAIYCNYSCPKILNNKISNNKVNTGDGGGIYCYYSNPEIIGNDITMNFASNGGAIQCNFSSPDIIENSILFNDVVNSGGGLKGINASSPRIIKNVIIGNEAMWGGAMDFFCFFNSEIKENIIAFNRGISDGGGACH
jgi:predicted outer membrane repeat protein